MAKPNFQFEKRQKELAKKKKHEEKLKRRLERHGTPAEAGASSEPAAPMQPEPASS